MMEFVTTLLGVALGCAVAHLWDAYKKRTKS